MKVIKGIVHQPYEVKGNSIFYAFSYYFDRAVETGLIGEWAHAKSLSGTIISCDHYHLMHNVGIQITCCFFFCIDDRGGVLEVRDFKKRAKEGRSRFLKACTLWERSELHTVHIRALKTTKPCLARPHPDNYDHPFAKMHCKTQITYSSCSAWRWCTVRFIDQMGCYVRPFGLEKRVWLGPGWQLRWGSLSGPGGGGGAPDSYTPPIWRHHHPPAALHWPSALLLTPPCLHNRTNQNGHLLITSHIR